MLLRLILLPWNSGLVPGPGQDRTGHRQSPRTGTVTGSRQPTGPGLQDSGPQLLSHAERHGSFHIGFGHLRPKRVQQRLHELLCVTQLTAQR